VRYINFNNSTIIYRMQHDDEILYKAIGRTIKKIRKEKGIKFTIFCYENDIPKSTLYDIEHGNNQAYFSKIFNIVKCLDVSFEEFARLLENEINVSEN